MRRIITRLIMAQLIPLAIRAGKKALRKKKHAAENRENQEPSSNRDYLEADDAHDFDMSDRASD